MWRNTLFASLFVLAACASSQQSSGPPVTVGLEQLNASSDIFYFPGPVNLQYQISVSNPTDQPITFRRLDLRTDGPGPYFLRTTGSTMNIKVAPKSTANFTVSAWGTARGGYIASSEPVTLNGTAYFDSASGPFVKLIHQNAWPR